MPIPESGEEEKNFIPRCISYIQKEHPDWSNDKCVAVCYDIWKRSKEHDYTPSGNVFPSEAEPGEEVLCKGCSIDTIKKSSDIQSLIFAKDKFTKEQAISWANSHGFKSGNVEDTTNTFRLRQFPPEDCTSSGGMKELAPGVTAYICRIASKKSLYDIFNVRRNV